MRQFLTSLAGVGIKDIVVDVTVNHLRNNCEIAVIGILYVDGSMSPVTSTNADKAVIDPSPLNPEYLFENVWNLVRQ